MISSYRKKTFPACFVTSGELSITSCSITFYLAVGLTALSFVLERKEGLLDRCWVAGKSFTQAHTLKNDTRAVLYYVSRGSAVINKGRELARSYLMSNYDSFQYPVKSLFLIIAQYMRGDESVVNDVFPSVPGVSSLETMLAHLFSQLLVISVQIILLLLFILLVFNVSKQPQRDPS